MNLFTALDLSSSAMDAHRMRMNVLSSNLANMNSTRADGGGPYQKKMPIFASEDIIPESFDDQLDHRIRDSVKQVKVVDIAVDQSPPRKVYEPTHPDADDEGYVAYPNINLMEELVNIMSASRSYEANITAMNATKSMLLKALQIGQA